MTQEIVRQNSLFAQLAKKYKITEQDLLNTLKNTIMKPDKTGRAATDSEIITFLLVASKYDLNPFTKEIYAFPDKRAGIVPIVGVDGFITLANRQREMNGYEVSWSEDMVTNDGAKQCPSWCEVKVYRKDRDHPTIVREYLDEVYREPFKSKEGYIASGPWQTHTKRMLRHKTLIQALRVAFGFVGIYDEDEAQRIIEATNEMPQITMKPAVQMPKAISSPEAQKDSVPGKMDAEKTIVENSPLETPNSGIVVSSLTPVLQEIEQLAITAFKSNKTAFNNWLGAEYGCEKIQEVPENIKPKVIQALKEMIK